ncbi:MAG: calcium/sodium antiporter [Candidatus Woesearchaeota archaeon]
MIANIWLALAGVVLLVKGSDFFVKAAASIAKNFGISDFVIGLTLVAIGTSIPELAASVTAALSKQSGLIVGNAVGSNIANIGLIVGLTCIFSVIKTDEEMLKRDGYVMMLGSILFFLFILDNSLSRVEAGVLILVYLAYVIFLVADKPKYKGKYGFKSFVSYFLRFEYVIDAKILGKKGDAGERHIDKAKLVNDFIVIVFGGVAIVMGAKYLVESAVFFARIFDIPDTIVGISLIAIGTSLPELSVSISAAKEGLGNIALGNIIGSNIANILLVAGISGVISPLSIIDQTKFFFVPFMIFISLLMLIFLKSEWKLRRTEGIALLGLYVIFLLITFLVA